MKFNFVKVSAATPNIHVADCAGNTQAIIELLQTVTAQGTDILCLPELCITGYTCGDLFFQPVLQKGALTALQQITSASEKSQTVLVVGLPIQHDGKLYNCAAVLQSGKILGIVPKTHLPNYNEFYEQRHFFPAPAENSIITLLGQTVPFGTKQLFQAGNSLTCFAVEICEDLWAPLPPSTMHAMHGANIVLNLSASNEIIGKADYRRALVSGQSARLFCGYVYCDAGFGESTTDMVFAGHNLIAENGTILAENKPFSDNTLVTTEIDVERLQNERLKNTTYPVQNADGYVVTKYLENSCNTSLTRKIDSAPFVPANDTLRAQRCEAILAMQSAGLRTRLAHIHCQTAVVGISGGLDSCLALLVMVHAYDAMQLPRKNILAVTMPCFGTTQRTKSNAERLCEELGVTLQSVDITDTVRSNFADIGQDENEHSVTFENVQARVRTLVLMNIANKNNGIVVGTGDLSELALGWCTYNGDHMSMYGVNGGVPKTLVRHIVAYCADIAATSTLTDVLRDILATPVSPELLPAENGEISQQTESIVGPYKLHDFFLYYAVRWGFSPAKIFYLAQNAFAGKYDDVTLKQWMQSFYKRFFAQQFKRSCLPDGPKVGSVSLSPRADWRMPSDAVAKLWLDEVAAL